MRSITELVIPGCLKEGFGIAKTALERSYSPYSRFRVACAIKHKDKERFIAGCNIENASFGATICAERTAIFASIAEYGKQPLEVMVLITDKKPNVTPCGLCLQVMQEFCSPEFPIYMGDVSGIKYRALLKELLPYPFMDF